MKSRKLLALIPARSGSERIKNKNLIKLKGKSLIRIAIENAFKAKIFDRVIVSTDDLKYSNIAKKCGAEVPFLRPKKLSISTSPDYDWVSHTIKKIDAFKLGYTHFFILRPTSPFRTYKTILRAWRKYKKTKNCESLRAVEICKQHPYKMWVEKNNFINPLFKKKYLNQPSYNSQFKVLPRIFIQNASLEISNISVIKKYKSITGKKILPFYTHKHEGFDINYPEDIIEAKKILKTNY